MTNTATLNSSFFRNPPEEAKYYIGGNLVLVKRNNIPVYSRFPPLALISADVEIYWDKKLVFQILGGSCTLNRIMPKRESPTALSAAMNGPKAKMQSPSMP